MVKFFSKTRRTNFIFTSYEYYVFDDSTSSCIKAIDGCQWPETVTTCETCRNFYYLDENKLC